MSVEDQQFAIVNGVRTDHKATAICEVWVYDVWGNADDGYEVNDRSCIARLAEIPATMLISGAPRYPGAKDDYRSFPAESSCTVEVTVSWDLDVSDWFGDSDNGQGDGETYYFDDPADGRPLGEMRIVGWCIPA